MSLTIISLRLLSEFGLVHQILPVTHVGQREASVFREIGSKGGV